MEIDHKDVHLIKNQLAISIGMIELAQKMILRDGKDLDVAKLSERLERGLIAQKKIKTMFEDTPPPTDSDR